MDVTSSSYVGRDFVVNDTKPMNYANDPTISNNNNNNNTNNFHHETYPGLTISDRHSEYSDSSDSTDSETSSQYDRRKARERERSDKNHRGDTQVIEGSKDDQSDYLDYRFFWLLGLLLLLVSAAYYYWSTIECNISENDETNLTIQYALEKFGPIEYEKENYEEMPIESQKLDRVPPV
jgi:hypothetical protein